MLRTPKSINSNLPCKYASLLFKLSLHIVSFREMVKFIEANVLLYQIKKNSEGNT